MSETNPTSAQPPVLDTRVCRKCNEAKVLTPETWVYRPNKQKIYGAHGTVCLACEKARKAEFDAKRKEFADAVKSDTPKAEKPEDKRKEVTAASKMDVALALKAGSRALNSIAPGVLARVAMWAEDEGHENHLWAVEFFAQRILPRKLYEELGGQAAGVGAIGDKRPQFQINILPAHPEAPQGRVISGDTPPLVDVTEVEDVSET